MGSLILGASYRVRFDKLERTWITRGKHQGRQACLQYEIARKETRESNPDKPEKRLNLWGRIFTYSEDGSVYDHTYGHVGHIYFD